MYTIRPPEGHRAFNARRRGELISRDLRIAPQEAAMIRVLIAGVAALTLFSGIIAVQVVTCVVPKVVGTVVTAVVQTVVPIVVRTVTQATGCTAD